MVMALTIKALAGDIDLWPNNNYSGNYYSLMIGDSIDLKSNREGLSFRVNNEDAALLVKVLDIVGGNWEKGDYENMFFYSDISAPNIPGTEQYSKYAVRVYCISSGSLPIPPYFVPIDGCHIHPDATPYPLNNFNGLDVKIGDTVLYLRRSFFWENAEQLNCDLPSDPHGPYGDIKINVTEDSISFLTYEELLDPTLWHVIRPTTVFGPIWGAAACGPNPHNEWVDGPWGCVYSNVPIFNWNQTNIDSAGLIVSEADKSSPSDFLGSCITRKNDIGLFLFKVGVCGWIILENKIITPTNYVEESIEHVSNFYYPTWDGHYPAIVKGPDIPGIERGNLSFSGCVFNNSNIGDRFNGSQYYPYFEYDSINYLIHEFDSVGIIGGVIPAGLELDKQITYIPLDASYSNEMKLLRNEKNKNLDKYLESSFPMNKISVNINTDRFYIYPNPSSGDLYINLDNITGKCEVIIYNNVGYELLRKTIYNSTLLNSNLSNGVYWVLFKDKDISEVHKLVISN